MNCSILPYNPEPIIAMRARVDHAIDHAYDLNSPLDGCMPGQQHEHVFDFEDGIRAIISVETGHLQNEDVSVLHLSFSLNPSSNMALIQFVERIESIPGELWPDIVVKQLHRFSTPRAVHYIFELPLAWKDMLVAA